MATARPASGDFRIDLPAKEMKKLKKQLDISLKEAAHAAALDLYSRFYTSLAKTVVTLADPYKIFRNTLVFNVEDIATKIKTMDITENATLQALARDALNLCKDLEIDNLRVVDAYRKSTNKNFKLLLAKVEKAYEDFESKK